LGDTIFELGVPTILKAYRSIGICNNYRVHGISSESLEMNIPNVALVSKRSVFVKYDISIKYTYELLTGYTDRLVLALLLLPLLS
jgi:hypothetical protein